MANALFNSTIRQNPNDIIYPTIGMGNFLNNWQNNPELVQKINNSPNNIGYSNEEITNYMGQGLNFGVPEIAEAQRQWGIRTPKTEHELDMANEGIFNVYPTTQNKKIDKGMYLADPTAKNPDANTFVNRMKNRIKTAPSSFEEAILGKPVEVLRPEGNVVDENGNITLQTGVGKAPRQGGIIKDFMTGARENYNESFNPENWGEKKNFATRLGEGLGTLARWGNTAWGRGLIAGGLIGALGGNPTEMTAYGLSAGVGRQQNRMQDQVYRNSLVNSLQNSLRNSDEFNQLSDDEFFPIKNDIYSNVEFTKKTPEEQQKQLLAAYNQALKEKQNRMLADIENQVNNYRGMMTGDIYGKLLSAQQLRDNAEWRNASLLLSAENNRAMRDIQRQGQQLQIDKMNADAARADRDYNFKVKQAAEENAIDWYKATHPNTTTRLMPAGSATDLSATMQGIGQMNKLFKTIEELPSRLTTPGISNLSAINPFDTEGQAFNQYVKTYKQVIGKGLEGGVLRKEDEYKYDQIIPKVGDTKAVLNKKAQQLQDMLIDKYNTDLQSLGLAGYDVGNFNYYPNQRNTQPTQTKKIGNYTVKVR